LYGSNVNNVPGIGYLVVKGDFVKEERENEYSDAA
jgi:hypothetical protein